MSTVIESPRYRTLPQDRSANEIELEVLGRWESEDLFRTSLEARAGGKPFVFFEGPPTANGRPGIHHVFSRTIKDLFCRHRSMQGYLVDRKAGWDTHGLPVEIEVEKELQISGKQQIEALGVGLFNQLCRDSVFKYRADWEKLSGRIGYWLDYDNAYVTYTHEYVESVWWALATLFRKDLLYKGHKILPYCSRCGTALSSHEVAQGYEDVADPSVYVALELEKGNFPGPRRILVWTTTPWTLVSNVALAVHPDIEYVELSKRGKDIGTIVLAAERCADVLGADFVDRWEEKARFKGTELVGLSYKRPLNWVDYPAGSRHEVVVEELFVSAADGTGIVHMAPAFGADDYASGVRNQLAFLQPVDSRGRFPDEMPVVAGLFVKDADPLIIEELEKLGVLWKSATLTHSYPHCWRCRTPLLYYARESWFVRTTAFKDEMLRRNALVNWNPAEMGAGRFGGWLENNIDWAISRDRYWGTPLPLWVCENDGAHVEAIGSYEELAARHGAALPPDFDPHKPHVDSYTWKCESCAAAGNDATMRRAPEVIDAWFDSGSMPFAQWHYPFENEAELAAHFPADFIAEGVDQTRGWFYSLLAIATGLGDSLPRGQGERETSDTSPFRAVVVNDLVLDAAGQKMSKSRGNTVDPWSAIPRHGADAVRLFLVSSSQVWVPRRFDEDAIRETSGRFLLTLRNVFSGIFAELANFGWSPSELDPAPADRPAIDRWILSRLRSVELEVNRQLTNFDATVAVRELIHFVDEDVSKWYVRVSRRRFYAVDGEDNRAAFATLHEVLTVVCRLLAPFAPFVTDWMHRELTGTSVHLASFVRESGSVDPKLEAAMSDIRELARLGRAAREEARVKVRQALSRVVCVVPAERQGAVAELAALLREELNVKVVEFVNNAEGMVSLSAKANFRALGKRFGGKTPLAAAAVSALSDAAIRAFESGQPLTISVEGSEFPLEVGDFEVVRNAQGELVMSSSGTHVAAINPTITVELRAEGLVREVVSRVQRMRKDAGLALSDRISLWIKGPAEVEEAVRLHAGHVAAEVLAREVMVAEEWASDTNANLTVEVDGLSVAIAIRKEK